MLLGSCPHSATPQACVTNRFFFPTHHQPCGVELVIRDKLYDLRECNLSGADASGYDLSGVIMTKTDVSKAKFVESYFSKGYLHGTRTGFSSFNMIICVVESNGNTY